RRVTFVKTAATAARRHRPRAADQTFSIDPKEKAVFLAIALLAVATAAMLAVDLLVFARDHRPSLRESAAWSVLWLAVALAFGAGVLLWEGGHTAGEYYAGYLLERALSLDNVFVFAVILGAFAVPAHLQPKV